MEANILGPGPVLHCVRKQDNAWIRTGRSPVYSHILYRPHLPEVFMRVLKHIVLKGVEYMKSK